MSRNMQPEQSDRRARSVKTRLRFSLVVAMVLTAMPLGLSSEARAQAPLLAQVGAPPVTRPLWFDGAITVASIGLGLFVVCRNSNRN